MSLSKKKLIATDQPCAEMDTLLGTNISPEKPILKMVFLFPRWDMLIPQRVVLFFFAGGGPGFLKSLAASIFDLSLNICSRSMIQHVVTPQRWVSMICLQFFHPYSQGKRSDFDTVMIFGTWVGKNQPWNFVARKEPAMEIYFT